MNADEKTIKIFSHSDQKAWEDHFYNLSTKDLEGLTYGVSNIQIKFEKITIERASYKNVEFTKLIFELVVFKECSFKECTFNEISFSHCTFVDCDFSKSKFISCAIHILKCEGKNRFKEVKLLRNSSLANNLTGIDFRNSEMPQHMTGCRFIDSDLRGVSMVNANLANTNWENAKIDRFTNITNASFDKHPVTRDDSEFIKFSWPGRHWPFNWGAIRILGNSPIFRVSWGLFIFSLFVINSIGFLNETKPVIFEGLNYIPVPPKLYLTVISSLLLILGGLIYGWQCPEKVKSFTVSEWVFEHGHPRVDYLIQCLKNPFWLTLSVLLLFGGGILALWIILSSVLQAAFYTFLSL